MNRNLQQLGQKNGTDKHDEVHSFAGKSYLDVYEDHFDSIKESATCILELGVLHGRSLKTWRDYFINAQIWGIDIDPTANQNYGERINIVTGNQVYKSDLDKIAEGKQFDVIIDDGSHLVDHIIGSFEILWPKVKSKGFYCIEDLGCTYVEDLIPYRDSWPGMKYNPDNTNYKNDRIKLENVFLDFIHQMDSKQTDIRGVYFTTYQCIIQKI